MTALETMQARLEALRVHECSFDDRENGCPVCSDMDQIENQIERLKMPDGVPPQFDTAADLILDALEDAFGIVAPGGRDTTKKAVIAVLNYYCIPREAQVQDQ